MIQIVKGFTQISDYESSRFELEHLNISTFKKFNILKQRIIGYNKSLLFCYFSATAANHRGRMKFAVATVAVALVIGLIQSSYAAPQAKQPPQQAGGAPPPPPPAGGPAPPSPPPPPAAGK